MNPKRLKRSLRSIVGPKAVLDDPGSLAAYSYDSSLQIASPDFVLFPQTTEQIAQIVTLLASEGVPYVARGAGTNLSGGSIPVRGGAVIALARMKRIISIDTENQCARVEPGVTNLALQDALTRHGFFYAPDPASQKVSTLGGNFAENSGGPHCLKYGVTTNHILGAKLVTPSGEVVELGGEKLESPDAGLLGLLVGAEGTLGIATELACRIIPLPESVKTMLGVFDSTEQAGQTVSDIIAAGILPATLEMMDNMVIQAVEQALQAGYPTDAAAVLIIEIDGPREGLDETAAEIEAICSRNKVREVRTARDETERAQLWAGRRGAFGAVARLFPNYSVSDGTVPRTRLPEVLRQVAEIGRMYDLEIGNVFHAGDGNLHPLIFFDLRDEAQLEKVHRAGEEILRACIEAGGTITGEHGVGIEKIEAMPTVFGANEIELMRRIKKALDPADLCNPGKILPDPIADDNRTLSKGAAWCGVAGESEISEAPTFIPSTPAELSEIILDLKNARKTFTPVGARTLFNHLPGRTEPGAFIATTGMGAIVEHDPANLTATVQAGLSLGELGKTLAGAGQFLPLDAPNDATLGGIIAAALPGPRRHMYGAARDFVLGLEFAAADGCLYRAGGKTVKNVAGYDFGKLLVGSWGTLGIITEITLRLLPQPKACGAVLAGFEKAEDAYAAAIESIASRLNPAVATLLNSAASTLQASPVPSSARYILKLGAEGSHRSVEMQLEELAGICKKNGAEDYSISDDKTYRGLLATMTNLFYAAENPESQLSVFVAARCADVIDVIKEIERFAAESEEAPPVVAHIAGGSIYSCFSRSASDAQPKGSIAGTLVARFPHANVMVRDGRSDFPDTAPFIDGGGKSAALRRAIKECLDPDRLLSPWMREW
jgi:glycolate oxidase subunit GlcD